MSHLAIAIVVAAFFLGIAWQDAAQSSRSAEAICAAGAKSTYCQALIEGRGCRGKP